MTRGLTLPLRHFHIDQENDKQEQDHDSTDVYQDLDGSHKFGPHEKKEAGHGEERRDQVHSTSHGVAATELGMRPLMERVIERLDRIQAQPSRPPAYPAGLSEREVEVLRLLASGKSNAVIAAELVLSIRTVERHISNIYGKTNSHGRAEATAFAFIHGLMSST